MGTIAQFESSHPRVACCPTPCYGIDIFFFGQIKYIKVFPKIFTFCCRQNLKNQFLNATYSVVTLKFVVSWIQQVWIQFPQGKLDYFVEEMPKQIFSLVEKRNTSFYKPVRDTFNWLIFFHVFIVMLYVSNIMFFNFLINHRKKLGAIYNYSV